MVLPEEYYGYEAPPTMDNLPGYQGGGSERVDIDVDTVYGMGLSMSQESEVFAPQAEAISTQFEVDSSGMRNASYPMGAGLARISPSVRSAFERQDFIMTYAAELVRNQAAGTKALANISMRIVSEFSGTDELNAADIDRVREITGIEEPPPPPSYGGGHRPMPI